MPMHHAYSKFQTALVQLYAEAKSQRVSSPTQFSRPSPPTLALIENQNSVERRIARQPRNWYWRFYIGKRTSS